MKIYQQQLIKLGKLAEGMDAHHPYFLEPTNLKHGDVVSLEGHRHGWWTSFLVDNKGATTELGKP